MKIALLGYGKMGKTIEAIALKKGHEIVAKVNSTNADTIIDLSRADVAIEFSKPDVASSNIQLCFEANVPVVSGTTGWNAKLQEIKEECIQKNQSLFYSANFSIGVNIFFEINEKLAQIMDSQDQYDEVLIHESHHIEKLDSPSGTAIVLAQQIINKMERYSQWVNYKADENVDLSSDQKGDLPIFSTREEDTPGTHIVKYFSDNDELEIIHKALNRTGFAQGAVAAAEFLRGKKGVYGMKDLLNL
jgi:4-hydroxy-tetrahydrodipicolinate reductase